MRDLRFEWKGLRYLEAEISVWESEGYDNGSCSGVSLVRTSRFLLPGRKYRRGRETLPSTFP